MSNQTDKIKEFMQQQQKPVKVEEVVSATGFKKTSILALLSAGVKKGVFTKAGLREYCLVGGNNGNNTPNQ